jgi:hypothetical protein
VPVGASVTGFVGADRLAMTQVATHGLAS